MITWKNRARSYPGKSVTEITCSGIKEAPADALTLSCADKTANIIDMCRWLGKGYRPEDFISRDHQTQLEKFEALDAVYRGKVVESVYGRFTRALDLFRGYLLKDRSSRGRQKGRLRFVQIR